MPDNQMTGLIKQLQTGLIAIPAGQADDEALRAFISFKDQTAFAALIQRHGPMVFRVCQRVLQHAQDAEDAFQATFLVLARRAGTIDKSGSLASWLHGVAYRVALRAKRDAGRRRARERQAIASTSPDHVESLAWQDVQALLECEIERLPQRYRAAFVLCHLEGRSRAEAASELGIPENTLSSRLARARERLQQRLSRRSVNLSAILAAIALTTESSNASIAPALIESTAAAAPSFAMRQAVSGISSSTLRITHEAMRTMAITKAKWMIGAAVLGTMLTIGAWSAGQFPGETPTSPSGRSPIAKAEKERATVVTREADFAQRQRSLKNLKLILLAMHNYLDTYGQFPDDVLDKDGKPILSWRVKLLPYLEADNLYKQFHLNEPWDSEHNFKLLVQMPSVFRVGFEAKDATHTYYQRFIFPGGTGVGMIGSMGAADPFIPGGSGSSPGGSGGTPVPIMPGGVGLPMGIGASGDSGMAINNSARFPLRIAEITDGLSFTLGVVEAGPPVPWIKPADIVCDPMKPLSLIGPFANVRNAGMLDGSTHSLKPDLDESTMRKLIMPNDGQVAPAAKTLRASFTADTEDAKKALSKLVEQNQELIAALEVQIAEHAALLELSNKLNKDLDRAEEEQDRIRAMIENLKAKNKKLRDELGLRGGAPIPK